MESEDKFIKQNTEEENISDDEINRPAREEDEIEISEPQVEVKEEPAEEANSQDATTDELVKPVTNDFPTKVVTDLDSQRQKHETIWAPVINTGEHNTLDAAYHEISPRGVVFFDVADQQKFREEARKNYEILRSRLTSEVIRRWDENEMDRMFGKGLNPTSLITSLESAQWFERNLEDKDGVILELGPGSGWSTVMLFNTLREGNPNGRTRLISVDMSAHAIAASQTLFEYSNIPYVLVSSDEEFNSLNQWLENTEEGKQFAGIILVFDKFEEFVTKAPDRYFSGVYSSHGTAYLSQTEYHLVLENLQKKLKPSGIFVADSLNPLYTNKLHKFLTIAQMVAPGLTQKILTNRGIKYIVKKGTRLKSNSKYFQGQDVTVLQGFNTPHAYLIFKWCNYLIRKGEIKRLLDTKKSLEVTMDVVEAYRDDVFPSYLLEGMIEESGFKYSKLTGRPDFPIFMDTQGFRLNA